MLPRHTLPPRMIAGALLAAMGVVGVCPLAAAAEPPRPASCAPEGFVAIFDGQTLDGWSGDRAIWSVRGGAITGRTTAETRLKENNFLAWKEEVEDFELRLKFRLKGGNSGIYYRALRRPEGSSWRDPLVGTQADFDSSGRWTGVIMEYLLRGVLAERGQRVVIDQQGNRRVVGSVGDPDELLKVYKPNQWNDYTVIARGGHVVLKINGVTMCELIDRDPRRIKRGVLALQVHRGPPMTVQFKDIYLRHLRPGQQEPPRRLPRPQEHPAQECPPRPGGVWFDASPRLSRIR